MRPGFDYVVQTGDCISSVAESNGYFWQTIWDANPDLKSLRRNPNVLFAGDVVKIPDSVDRNESCATDNTYTFVKRGTPAKFRLVLEHFGVPLANRSYILKIDGKIFKGKTDGSGLLEVHISPAASSGHLRLPDDNLECDLALGDLDPQTELVGVQQRLQNLGFLDSDPNGEMNEETSIALMEFQSSVNLPTSGELDDATREKLLQMHDQVHPQQSFQHDRPDDSTDDDSQEQDIPADVDPAEDEAEMARFTAPDNSDGSEGDGEWSDPSTGPWSDGSDASGDAGDSDSSSSPADDSSGESDVANE